MDGTLHCIGEIRAYWVDTELLSEIDNPRHHHQMLDNAAFVCGSPGGKIF